LYLLMVMTITPRHAGAAPRLPAGALRAQASSAEQQPLAKDEVMDLVAAGMDSAELAKKVEKLGINFEPTEAYLQALAKAGAQEVLLQALRNVNPKPLTRAQVLKLIAAGVPSARAAALVKQHGIDFQADDKYLHELSVAGADEALIAAVRGASKEVAGEMLVETSPGAAVYLDGELQGQADAKGELEVRPKLGAHAVKISLAGKQDFEQSVTISSREATRFEARLQDGAPSAGAVRENPRDGLKYVWLPAGTFLMGCSSGDNGCVDDEKPAHNVTLTQGFWIGQTEITVAAYKRFVQATGSSMPPEPKFNAQPLNSGWHDGAMPMVGLSWAMAQEYCVWAGGRLPTEAEWEYAARGGTTLARYDNLEDVAWYADNSGQSHIDSTAMWNQDQKTYFQKLGQNGDGIHAVAQKRPNPYGLFDMLGNASEWVRDWYDPHYYQNSPTQDPAGPPTGTQRILRGWCWFNSPFTIRVSHRGPSDPNVQGNACGARCVWSGNR
jgi:formylglycine-generating enzyme required for sulfatase activity